MTFPKLWRGSDPNLHAAQQLDQFHDVLNPPQDKIHAKICSRCLGPLHLNDNGKRSLEKLLKKFSHEQVMEAMRISVKQYIELNDGKPTQESVEKAWDKVGGICALKKYDGTNPEMKEIYYIRGILRNRLSYVNEGLALGLLRKSVRLGAPIEALKEFALEVKNWTNWRASMEAYIEHLENPDRQKETSKAKTQQAESSEKQNESAEP